ncbi:class I SAM-dependent methyltransferase [Halomicroarcula sp. S1AR25-4]|uniref:class I SAM-dependent methyltransferase n=1 Tax=Haloarcula sp. S1AR25-4 TaxID=2950538 RepID=UPI002875ECC6|nr:class I SAM-dependent methyltransferase [Halomicroarcula sp. S1AR25-4]MDS0276785.1 class I SAM-dependent methyltransferase [Halomicroarcula sp. S1AR25-4]
MSTDSARGYFRLQSILGTTEHFGGMEATEELARACQIEPGDRVLDVGVGTGITPPFLSRTFGCRVVGIDISPSMLTWARERVASEQVSIRPQFAVGDACRLPFASGTFDAVISESVLGFVDDPTTALREYARVTQPGGVVGVNEATWLDEPPRSLESYLEAATGASPKPPEEWVTRFEQAGLRDTRSTVRQVDPRTQFVSELRRRGITETLQTVVRLIGNLTDPTIRRYIRMNLTHWREASQVLAYLGYGIYVADVDS